MKKIHVSLRIHAPRETVWETVTKKELYEQWAEVFYPGSTVIGTWEKGSKMQFTAPNESGGLDGMFSTVHDCVPNEYLSLHHLGLLKNGVEDAVSEQAKIWQASFENYTLETQGGETVFIVDMNVPDEMENEINAMWEKGLRKLKEVAENGKSKTISTIAHVHAPISTVWNCYTDPEHITKWAFASDDWEAPFAENDVTVGGRFKTTMASKDGKNKFDFTGKYTAVESQKELAYTIDDGRTVTITFTQAEGSVQIIVTFEMENENSRELQKEGWQAILNNFKKHVESETSS